MSVRVFSTASAEQTIDAGRRIACELPPKCVVLLTGNLGAGKTTLAKGIIEGLGAASQDDVASPTFTLIHEYGDGRVYHVDLYRLDTLPQVETLGLDELMERRAIVLVEWGERFPGLWPQDRFEIRLTADENRRLIVVLGPQQAAQATADSPV